MGISKREVLIPYYFKMTEQEKWNEEILASSTYKNYLKVYNKSSLEQFVSNYVTYKNMWHLYGERYKDDYDYKDVKWVNQAENHLEVILDKKLFDMSCLWFSGNEKYNSIDISTDIIYWKNNIYNCPDIEPISEYDIDNYSQFLLQCEQEDNFHFVKDFSFDDLESYKDDEGDLEVIPGWYSYHNRISGNDKLLSLPNIKSKMERYYMEVYTESNKVPQPEQPPYIPPLPSVYFSDKAFLEKFMNDYEDETTKKLYKYHSWKFRNLNKKELIDENIEILLSSDEIIPIEAHPNFIEAIKITTHKYRMKKIVEHLPVAFANYNFNRQMSLDKENSNHIYGDMLEVYDKFRKEKKEKIISARKILGEPENFDY